MGVSAFFFLPVFVAAFTRADEFHSVTKTRCPSALSHFASSPSCVVLPDPSMPSTTKSFPGYSCGCVRLFSIWLTALVRRPGLGAADFEPQWLACHPFERRGVPARGPELQLRVTRCPQLEQIVLTAIVQVESSDRLRMAAIETLRQAQDRGERADRRARAPAHVAESVVTAFGCDLTMVARHERDGFDFVRLESAQVAVLDQIVGMFVMLF